MLGQKEPDGHTTTGPNTGLPVSRLGVGLAEIGGLDLAEARQAAEVLNLALDSGVTFFDTSACMTIVRR